MSQWLVTQDYIDQEYQLTAGTVISDGDYNIAALQARFVPIAPYTENMEGPVEAYLEQRSRLPGGVAQLSAQAGRMLGSDQLVDLNSAPYYKDEPSGQEAVQLIPPFRDTGPLVRWLVRCDLPPSGSDTCLVRLYRYRRQPPGYAFSYTLVSTPYTITSAFSYSYTYDFSGLISNRDFLPGDALAVSTVTSGTSMRALSMRIGWEGGPVEVAEGNYEPPPMP